MSIETYTPKRHGMVSLLDFLILVLIVVLVFFGTLVYSINLSRRSGHDVTRIPFEVDPQGKVGTD